MKLRGVSERWLVIALLLAASAYAIAEDITLTTYYPSPRGVYDELKTMGKTTLAQSGGSVGIGTANPDPSAVLDLSSTTKGLLPPRTQLSAIASPVDGLLVFDTDEDALFLRARGTWNKIIYANTQLLGAATLGADYTLTTTQAVVGGSCASGTGLCVQNVTSQRGLYSISWSGQVCVDAILGKVANIKILYGSAGLTSTMPYPDGAADDVGPPSNTPCLPGQLQDIGGGTMVQLNKGNNYRVRLTGWKTGNAAGNNSVVLAGATIKVELVLPF